MRYPRTSLRDLVLSLPLPQSTSRRATDAQEYWTDMDGERWASDSHLRDSVPGWDQIGPQHRMLFERFSRALGRDTNPSRVLEWGCGGGANAVAFAPTATEFIGVDVSSASTTECGKQIKRVCDTPFTPIVVSVDQPEAACESVVAGIDLFLCLYVIELLPSKRHAQQIMRVAANLLNRGGAAMVQVKYQTSSLMTRPRTWGYSKQIAAMTSFQIPEFWELTEGVGLTPHMLTLVPRNELDERYAYFFLTRED